VKIIIIRNANIYGHGGAEEFLLNLSKELVANGHQVVIATALPKMTHKAKKLGFKVLKSPWLFIQSWHGLWQFLMPLYVIWIFRLVFWYLIMILKEKPDILLPQNRDDWIASSISANLTGKRVIWSDHADLKHELKNIHIWYKNWQGKLIVWASRKAKYITVVSNADLQEIKKSIGNSLDGKLRVVHNGVFDEVNNIMPVKKPVNKIILGTTSRLMRQKGLFELIDAYKNIKVNHPNINLWLVGDGQDATELKKEAQKISGITFWGHVNDALNYAKSFDIFVHPTYTEGFSLSLVEAAMLGLPIVTTNVGGNIEIIEDGKSGLLVNPKNVNELQEAIEKLIVSKKTRDKLGKSARQRYLEEFEFSQIVRKELIPLYNY